MTTLGWVTLPLLVAVCSACSPSWEPPTITQKVHHFYAAVYGLVTKVTPDPRFDYGSGSTAYNATIAVYCYIKGGSSKTNIIVKQAGVIPGMCFSVDLQVGKEYLVFGRFEDGGDVMLPSDTSVEHSYDAMAKAAKACGVQPQTPTVEAAGAPVEACPMAAPPSVCEAIMEPPKGQVIGQPDPPPQAPADAAVTNETHHDDDGHDHGTAEPGHDHDDHDDHDHDDDHDDHHHHDHDGDGEDDHDHDDHDAAVESCAGHLATVLLLLGVAAVIS